MAQVSAKSAKPAPLVLDHKDIKILAAQERIPNPSQQDIADATGIPRSTVGDRLRRINSSEIIQQVQARLASLAPDCAGLYEDVIRLPRDQFGVPMRVALDTRLTVADRVLRGSGVHVEKSKQERSELPATAEGLFDALRSLSTYELNRFLALWEGRDPDGAGASDVVDGAEPSQDAPGTGVELQAQPVPDGDLPRPGA